MCSTDHELEWCDYITGGNINFHGNRHISEKRIQRDTDAGIVHFVHYPAQLFYLKFYIVLHVNDANFIDNTANILIR